MKRTNRQITFFVICIVSIFLVFFVGREYNKVTGQRGFVLATNGVLQFRKGLDISGGSRLVYQIDYSKYNAIYTDLTALAKIKKSVEDIILQNIDKRISSLGVSDYRSFIQTMNNEHYVIVEIGGVSNLDEAKEIIGKTVELEFKLPNTAPATAASTTQRRQMAQTLYAAVKASPASFVTLTENKGSEDILANTFTSAPLNQLPTIYQKNIQLLQTMATGSLSPAVLEGVYLEVPSETGGTAQSMEGFSFFRLVDRQIKQNPIINGQNVIQTAVAQGKSYKTIVSLDKKIPMGSYIYTPTTKTLEYAAQEVAPGGYAYNARIVSIAKQSMLGKDQQTIATEEARVAGVVKQVEGTIRGKLVTAPGVSQVYNDRVESSGLQKLIPNFKDTTQEITTYEGLDATYIVYNRSIKTPDQKMYSYITVSNLSSADWKTFEIAMKTTTLYTIEDAFIQNKQSWITAVDQGTNDVLNGGNFKMATVGSSQIGKPVVLIELDDKGKDIFCHITEQNIGKQMAIFVGGQLVTAPTIQDKICAGTAQIDGQFDGEGARKLVESLNDGALPAALIIKQEEKISPALGANALSGSLIAGLAGMVLIVVLMRFMYGTRKAMVALATLLIFLMTLLALVKLIDYALSLSAIAAIILSIGMGVDANVLIYERAREELKLGKSIGSAIDLGYERSRPAIRDGNLSTGLIALLLFTLGINIFKGFGSMMMINVLLILFLATPLVKELLHLAFHKKDVFLKEGDRWLEVKDSGK